MRTLSNVAKCNLRENLKINTMSFYAIRDGCIWSMVRSRLIDQAQHSQVSHRIFTLQLSYQLVHKSAGTIRKSL